jgi:hypothetical protein
MMQGSRPAAPVSCGRGLRHHRAPPGAALLQRATQHSRPAVPLPRCRWRWQRGQLLGLSDWGDAPQSPRVAQRVVTPSLPSSQTAELATARPAGVVRSPRQLVRDSAHVAGRAIRPRCPRPVCAQPQLAGSGGAASPSPSPSPDDHASEDLTSKGLGPACCRCRRRCSALSSVSPCYCSSAPALSLAPWHTARCVLLPESDYSTQRLWLAGTGSSPPNAPN